MKRSCAIRYAATLGLLAVTVAACGSDESSSPSAPVTVAGSADTDSEPVTEPVGSAQPIEVDCSALGEVAVGLQTGSFSSDGTVWEYQWTVPSSYDGTPLPVVLDFHGMGSSATEQSEFVGWPALAEVEGFIAVEPEGQGEFGWDLPQFDTEGRDDVAMVRDLLDQVAGNVCIDPLRIYATGWSMGGFFTSALVCDLGDVIAAAVSVSGVTHRDSCDPIRPVPFLAFHGTDDRVVPFEGVGANMSGGPEVEFRQQVMPEEFAEFASDFGCAESTDSAVSASVTLTAYTGCDADVEMGFYRIDGGGHTWPGSEGFAATAHLGVTTMEIDASTIAWDFLQRHTLSD